MATIAVDFDGTIVTHEYPRVPEDWYRATFRHRNIKDVD